jgi:hypothetical protein
MRLWHVGLILLLALPEPLLRAASGPSDALRACMQEPDDSRRLACYDREMARLAAAPPPAASPAPAPSPDKTFGLTPEQQQKLQPRATREKASPQTLSSTVSAVGSSGDGRMVITLANGQVWVQGEAYEVFRVSVGDAITIKPGLLGSFHMYAPSGYATRVTRAR